MNTFKNIVVLYDKELNVYKKFIGITFDELLNNKEAHNIDDINMDDFVVSDYEFVYPKFVNGKIVEKSDDELKLDGVLPLVDGEKIVDNKIVTIPKPEGVKIEWDGLEWKEKATQEEADNYNFNQDVVFYNQELEFASKANVELVCGIITENVFEEVKTYMKSIDPYAGIKTIPEIKRPEIFKKYL